MTISEPKFRVNQYALYEGEVVTITRIVGYRPGAESGWYYEISGKVSDYRPIEVGEKSIDGDVDSAYSRMKRRVLQIEEKLEDMLRKYEVYLNKCENFLESKEE